MKQYSMDLRERIVAACDRGEQTISAIAEQFQVSVRWIYKLLDRRKREGMIAPRTWRRGRKAAFTDEVLSELDALLAKKSDLTLEEIREAFAGRVSCSLQAVANAVKRLDWHYKKSPYGPASRTVRTCKKLAKSGGRTKCRSM